jgi:hypothetical protein
MNLKIKTSKIKTAFNGYSDPALSAFVKAIIIALTNNANFTETQLLLPALSASLDSFNTALANAQTRDKVMVGLKNTAKAELILQLSKVAASVTFEAAGDRDKLLSAGFVLYKDRSASPPLGKITDFQLTDGKNAGELTTQCKGVKGAKSYMHQITPDPLTASSVWVSFISTFKAYTFTNLVSNKKYWGRMIAIGTKDQSTNSDPLSRIAQ